MDAFKICDLLLSHVKSSNLNYSLQESPFSIHLSIKKSFIKDRNGDYLPGCIINNSLESSLYSEKKLVGENEALKEHLENYKSEKAEFNKDIHNLSIKLEKAKSEVSDLLSKNKTIVKEREALDNKLKEKDNETLKLKNVTLKLEEKEFELKKITSELLETKKELFATKKDAKACQFF